jgi:hypothetical protein
MDSLSNEQHGNIVRPNFTFPDSQHHIRIPDGLYSAEYVGSEGFYYLGSSSRVALCFRILDDIGSERFILGYYKVKKMSKNGGSVSKGQRVRNPDFEVGWRSRLARDLGVLFADFSPIALPTSVPSIDRAVRIKSTTVRKDPDGNDRPNGFWSSKVDCITGWAE